MAQLVPPHNSQEVKPLLAPELQRREARKRAEKLRKVPLDSRTVSDLFMLAMGAYTPLDGFMGHDDWRRSCLDLKLTSGVFWPIQSIRVWQKYFSKATSIWRGRYWR